jgi:hypothetical protein
MKYLVTKNKPHINFNDMIFEATNPEVYHAIEVDTNSTIAVEYNHQTLWDTPIKKFIKEQKIYRSMTGFRHFYIPPYFFDSHNEIFYFI